MAQKISLFDVDGTLYDGNLGIEFLKVLISQKYFSPQIGADIFSWHQKYKNGEVEKSVVVDEIYRLYAVGMTDLDETTAKEVAHATWENVKSNLFTFAPELVSQLASGGYQIVLLSGSPVEMIFELADYLGIDKKYAFGGELEIIDHKYTGQIISYPGSAEQKVEIIHQKSISLGLDIDWQSSTAMGDNERDSEVMKLVGHQVAFSPNSVLNDLARTNDWAIASKDSVLKIFSDVTV